MRWTKQLSSDDSGGKQKIQGRNVASITLDFTWSSHQQAISKLNSLIPVPFPTRIAKPFLVSLRCSES